MQLKTSQFNKLTLGAALCIFSLTGCQDNSSVDPSVSDLVKGVENSYDNGEKVETKWDGVSERVVTRASDEVIAAITEKTLASYGDFKKRFRTSVYLFDGYGVGVVPEANGCPSWSEKTEIHMDNEDSNTFVAASGWYGAFEYTGGAYNSILRLCQVDGRVLANPYHPHSVVWLGWNLYREYEALTTLFIDNENNNNHNSYSGFLPSPNAVDQNTTLWMASNVTPDVIAHCNCYPTFSGFAYGVFSNQSYNGLATGTYRTDDENGSNTSNLTPVPGYPNVVTVNGYNKRIPGVWVTYDTNKKFDTLFELAKVN
ncbi:hypothetical protein J2Y45_006417 [Dyadobacter sp. BE34]|uniref:Uncharacterized protein n=1 Tax=Dyadobacter fermentans TaxID=94254 RepID=A0ABU1R744_9BACT|nr:MULTISPECIES: hypothetical protein [Dyadobacter]MDR6809203.1 hypothetical protein [Dyadobacter fermentans]MDR7046946.1 hypothetical protein [Dyadobacter sp. BE242]MDR7201260.1 hypothetical protein [Dyadobacter sp. BE34]MDR7219220.1 hypothetical protein [Dyadobacter sp. BE31]MDR7264570.1 hypothetical protein [Dyadobacter sp. BE32]